MLKTSLEGPKTSVEPLQIHENPKLFTTLEWTLIFFSAAVTTLLGIELLK